MKSRIFNSFWLVSVLLLFTCFGMAATDTALPVMKLAVSPALNASAQAIAGEYNKDTSGAKLELMASESASLEQMQANGAALCILIGDELSMSDAQNNWNMVVGREIVVPIVNANNPYLESFQNKGVSLEALKTLLHKGVWTEANQTVGKISVMVDDQAFVKKAVTKYLSVSESELMYASSQRVIDQVKANKLSIGFCTLNKVAAQGNLPEGIVLLPIDANGDGVLSKVENIYGNVADFNRGVWIGKYPKALYATIYLVAAENPVSTSGGEFAKWMLTTGQETMETSGFTGLVGSEIMAKLSKLDAVVPLPESGTQVFNLANIAVVGALIVLIALVLLLNGNRNRKVKGVKSNQGNAFSTSVLNTNSIDFPEGMFYDKSHTWVFMEKNGMVRMGIDGFLQHITGICSRIILKDENASIKKGEPLFTLVHNGKQITVNAPVSGTVRSFNSQLISNSSLLNQSPYDEGWVYLIEPSNWKREVGFLAMADQYKGWIKNEFQCLKDFVYQALMKDEYGISGPVLQDGGELVENVLMHLGPQAWEEFQHNFLDHTN